MDNVAISLPTAYVVRREGNVSHVSVHPSIHLSVHRGGVYPTCPPPPRDRTAHVVLDKRRSVCLFRSRSRTVLLYNVFILILVKYQKRLSIKTHHPQHLKSILFSNLIFAITLRLRDPDLQMTFRGWGSPVPVGDTPVPDGAGGYQGPM